MEVKIQIPDDVYAQLLNSNRRMRGSILLASPKEGNFSPHRYIARRPRQYMRLPHGRVSISNTDVRMNLGIDRCEAVVPTRAIEGESRLACGYIDLMEEGLR